MVRAVFISPEKFQEMRNWIAEGETLGVIAARVGVGKSTALRIIKKHDLGTLTGKNRKNGAERIPIPDNFAELWPITTVVVLAARFGCSPRLIRSWAVRAGLPSKRLPPAPAKPKPFVRGYAPPKLVAHHKATMTEVWRDPTAAGEAQRILQGDKWVVYRCDENGRQSQGGKLWRCGRMIVTDAELIERAGRVSARNLEKAS